MESTGVYWIAPHEILEAQGFKMLLVDTRQLARVPGRDKKTDPTDCEWIQRLHSCGLLRGSFRPEETVCMLRTLVRDKANLVAESGDWVRRMQKSLDQMNVRVHRAVSDIDGVTGMAILRAIVGGERDGRKLARLRDPRCRKSEKEIAEQLSGHWREDHLFSLQQALKMYDAVQERITAYEKEILGKLGEMERHELRGQTPPPLPNSNKAKMIRTRGGEAAGIISDERRRCNPHRCHRGGKRGSGAQRIRPGFEPLPDREAVRLTCHFGAPRAYQRGQGGEEEEETEQRQHTPCRSFTHGGAFPAPQPDGLGSVLPQDRPTTRRRYCGVRHREEISHSDFSAAAMGASLCGRRRRGL